MKLNRPMSESVWARSRILIGFASLVSLAFMAMVEVGPRQVSTTSTGAQVRPSLAYSRIPLAFELNQGQSDSRVKFLARGAGYGLFLSADEAVLVLQHSPARTQDNGGSVVRMALEGASRNTSVAGSDVLPGRSNYFIGHDSARWRRNIPQFGRVRYQNIYPGIDLVYYGNQGKIEYDFEVSPGADPSAITLRFPGAQKVNLTGQGDLVLGSPEQVRFEAPRVYQKIGNQQRAVSGRFEERGERRVGFTVGDYDRSKTLIIDPVLAYASYLGGSGQEACSAIPGVGVAPVSGCPAVAVDAIGNIYIAGATTSADFPIAGTPLHRCLDTLVNPPTGSPCPAITPPPPADVFIAKINPSASSPSAQLIYSTYLGGTGIESTAGVGIDSGLNVIVAGNTTSTDFPVKGAFQSTPVPGSNHVFLSKIDSTGSNLVYSTYLSGHGTDTATGLAVDIKGKAYVTGTTTSRDQPTSTSAFPATLGAFQTSPTKADSQFFVSKIDPGLSGFPSLAYSTYLGGSNPLNGVTLGGGIAVDASSNVYVTGGTDFIDMPTLNAFQGSPKGGVDVWLAKLNPAAASEAQLLYATYLGGPGQDVGYGVAVDSATNAYVTGSTDSTDFNFTPPTGVAVFQAQNHGALDAFVAKVGPPCTTNTTSCAQGTVPLLYFTYLGGSASDVGLAIAVDSIQGALVTGWTNSNDFPLNSPPSTPVQRTFGGGLRDAFIARIDTTATSAAASGHFGTYLGGAADDAGTGIALDLHNQIYVAGETSSGNFLTNIPPPPSPFVPYQSMLGGLSDAFIAKLGPTLKLTVTETASPTQVGVGNQVSFIYKVVNNGDSASGITFNDTFSSTAFTFVSASSSPGSCGAALTGSVTCSVGTLNAGATATVTVILTANSTGQFTDGGQFTVFGSGPSFQPSSPASVTVNDFSISVAPTVATVPAGMPATYTVTVSPVPIGGGFPEPVSLSVTPLPPGVTQSFTNGASIPNLNSGAQSRQLVLSTTARVTTPASLSRRGGPLYAAWLPVSGLAFLGMGMSRKNVRRLWLAGILMAGCLALILFQAGCGSTPGTPTTTGTPAGTYTLTVTASSGSVSRTQQISLTVQ